MHVVQTLTRHQQESSVPTHADQNFTKLSSHAGRNFAVFCLTATNALKFQTPRHSFVFLLLRVNIFWVINRWKADRLVRQLYETQKWAC